MKNSIIPSFSILLGLSILIGSCARDNSVASNRGIQKRKYQNGFHFELSKKIKSNSSGNIEEQNDRASRSKGVEQEVDPIVETPEVNYDVMSDHASMTDDISMQVSKETPNVSASPTVHPPVNSSIRETKQQTIHFSGLSSKELKKTIRSEKKAMKKSTENQLQSIDPVIYILLCIFLPPVAVGLATDWDTTLTLVSLLLTIFFWLPGVIFAFYICDREGVF